MSNNEANSNIEGDFVIPQNEFKLYWNARKVGGAHEGTVDIAGGELVFDDGQIRQGKIRIDMQTIKVTDIEDPEDRADLEGHLRSSDFFDVKKHKYAYLEILDSDGKGRMKVKGRLTIRGISNNVTLEARVDSQNEGKSVVLATSFGIDRTQYGIKYKSKSFDDDLLDNFIYDFFEVSTKLRAVK
jgi:polyisoprenoid-binding protein YceI